MRYKIWNKKDPIITPIGEVLSAEEWIARYPVAGIESIDILCAAGEINGAFFGTLNSLVENYEAQGLDFSNCTTGEEKLALIDQYEKDQAAAQKKAVEIAAKQTSEQTRIADALEDIVALNLPTIE